MKKKLLVTMLMVTMLSFASVGCAQKEEPVDEFLPVVGESTESTMESTEAVVPTEESVNTKEEVKESEAASDNKETTTQESVVASSEATESKAEENTKPSASKPQETPKPSTSNDNNSGKTDSSDKKEDNANSSNGGSSNAESTKPSVDKEETVATPTPTPKPTPEPTPEATPKPTPTPTPEAPKQEVHNHNMTTKKEGTECGGYVVTTYCKDCGYVESEKNEGGSGHQGKEEIEVQPSCTEGGWAVTRCTICGEQLDNRILPPEPHDYEDKVIVEGDCASPQVTQEVCKVCGRTGEKHEDWDAHADDHDWVTGTYDKWDDEAFAVVPVERTYCSRCNKDK